MPPGAASDPRPGEAKLALVGGRTAGLDEGRAPPSARHRAATRTRRVGCLPRACPRCWRRANAPATRRRCLPALEPFAQGVSGVAIDACSAVGGSGARAQRGRQPARRACAHRRRCGRAAAIARARGAGRRTRRRLRACGRALARPVAAAARRRGARAPARLAVRERLRRYAAGGAPDNPLPAWRALLTSWQGARR